MINHIKLCLPIYTNRVNLLIGVLLVTLLTLSAQARAVDKSINTNENSSDINARAQLHDIIISDDYSEVSEIQYRRPIPRQGNTSNNEDQKSNDWLDDIDIDEDFDGTLASSAGLATFVKFFVIGALVVFVIWVVLKASGLNLWNKKLGGKNKRQSVIHAYNPKQLSQGWESLPPHDKIPSVVMALVQKNDYNQAASILYRGALRWLATSHAIHIAPATTEMQCIAQIKQLNQLGVAVIAKPTFISKTLPLSSTPVSNLSDATSKYIIRLIHLWIKTAYDPNQNKITKTKTATSTIPQICDDWFTYLPLQTMSHEFKSHGFKSDGSRSTRSVENKGDE